MLPKSIKPTSGILLTLLIYIQERQNAHITNHNKIVKMIQTTIEMPTRLEPDPDPDPFRMGPSATTQAG